MPRIVNNCKLWEKTDKHLKNTFRQISLDARISEPGLKLTSMILPHYNTLSLSHSLWIHGREDVRLWIKGQNIFQEFLITGLRGVSYQLIAISSFSLRNFVLRLIAAWAPTLCAEDNLNGVLGCHLHSFILTKSLPNGSSAEKLRLCRNAPPWIER